MADPFEVRMRFTSQLQHLNASTTSAMKAANYALKYAEFSDDLFSCILEQLERTNMNLRANIMYFLPALCDSSRAQGEPAYVDMLERDIPRIIDLVAPGDGSGAANVKAVRRVLQQLLQKEFLTQDVVAELEEHVASRDSNAPASPRTGANAAEERGGVEGGGGGGGGAGGGGGEVSGVPSVSRNTPMSAVREPAGFTTGIRLDKRQIEQRIEEDRERHKRAREGIWAVSQKGVTSMTEDNELGKLWDEVLDMTEDDRILGKEEMEERRACIEFEDV